MQLRQESPRECGGLELGVMDEEALSRERKRGTQDGEENGRKANGLSELPQAPVLCVLPSEHVHLLQESLVALVGGDWKPYPREGWLKAGHVARAQSSKASSANPTHTVS